LERKQGSYNKAINTMLFTFGIRGLEYNWFGKSVFRTCYCGVMVLNNPSIIDGDITIRDLILM
ncbi:hypothetical protein, partial [Aliivibrio finisterrensis]|uniref:hypothetical protein n=1 Tax=Aliivibrio finisterrensis TaxID=511998 RepID=UPI001A9347C1